MKAQLQWLIGGVVLLLVGIFVLVNPTTVLKVAVIGFGLYTMIEALYALVMSFSFRSVGGVFTFNAVRSLLSLVIGLLVVYFAATSSGASVAGWTVYLIAIWLLVSAIGEIVEIQALRKAGFDMFSASNAIVSIVLALIMFLFPVVVNNAIFITVGVFLILIAIGLIVWGVRMMMFEKRLKDEFKVSETEWEEKS